MAELRYKEGDLGASESKLIFTCSGAADVGEIADKAGRRLAAEGAGKMSCLSGIGGRVPGFLEAARLATQIIVIDGCGEDCAKKTLARAGFKEIRHIRVTDLDMEEGKSPVTKIRVRKVVDKAKESLRA